LFSAFLCEDLGFSSAVNCPNINANRRGTRRIPQRTQRRSKLGPHPRIPFETDFRGFADIGKHLAEIHVNYEQQGEYPLERIE